MVNSVVRKNKSCIVLELIVAIFLYKKSTVEQSEVKNYRCELFTCHGVLKAACLRYVNWNTVQKRQSINQSIILL